MTEGLEYCQTHDGKCDPESTPGTKTYRFTFGSGWGPLGKRYVRIDANDRLEARVRMEEMFGRRWSFDYDQFAWDKGQDHLKNLRQLVVGDEGIDSVDDMQQLARAGYEQHQRAAMADLIFTEVAWESQDIYIREAWSDVAEAIIREHQKGIRK